MNIKYSLLLIPAVLCASNMSAWNPKETGTKIVTVVSEGVNKGVTFCKEHKKATIIAASTLAAGTGAYAAHYYKLDTKLIAALKNLFTKKSEQKES